MQQLNTHQAFKECSGSFRYVHCGEHSGSLASSRCQLSKSLNPSDSPFTDGAEPASRPVSFLLQKEVMTEKPEFSRKEYESTSFRIQSLEQELMSLKRSLQWQNIQKKTEQVSDKPQSLKPLGKDERSLSRKSNPLGQVTNCVGSVSFASQRRCANRLLKVFRRITLFGSRKLKQKPGGSGLWSKPM